MQNIYTVADFQQGQPCINILPSGVEGSDLQTAARSISLISQSARQAVDAAVQRGLCYRRFQADITLAGGTMPLKGARLACNDLVLHILPEGKRCFPECLLVQNELDCPLRDGVRFASVAAPGALCLGDRFHLLPDEG